MSAKMGRRAKPHKPDTQAGPAVEDMDSPNLSVIERASFMEGLQQNFGNPLHSTAVEEDLDVFENQKKDGEKAGGKQLPKTSKPLVKQSGNAVKKKTTEKDAESEGEQKKKKSRKSTVETVEAEPEKAETKTRKKKGAPQKQKEKTNTDKEESDTEDVNAAAAAKKPTNRRRSEQATATRKVIKKRVKKDGHKSGSGKSDGSEPQEESDAVTVQKRQRKVLSSDEDVTDEDTSWNPSQDPGQRKRDSLDRNRKSLFKGDTSVTPSSDSTTEETNKDNTEKQRRKKQGSRSTTELEVVLDTFTDFCDQYRESVESKAVKHSIISFSNSMKQQLMEKITSQKELKVLRRENAKVGSLIRKRTQRLLDDKHEMIQADRQLMSLKKEKSELTHRLSDLRQGQALLHDLRELNRLYLDYRKKHPKKKETYGASSQPALQLEIKQKEAASTSSKSGNQVEKRQKMNGAKK